MMNTTAIVSRTTKRPSTRDLWELGPDIVGGRASERAGVCVCVSLISVCLELEKTNCQETKEFFHVSVSFCVCLQLMMMETTTTAADQQLHCPCSALGRQRCEVMRCVATGYYKYPSRCNMRILGAAGRGLCFVFVLICNNPQLFIVANPPGKLTFFMHFITRVISERTTSALHSG